MDGCPGSGHDLITDRQTLHLRPTGHELIEFRMDEPPELEVR